MKSIEKLIEVEKKNESILCVGLDIVAEKMPQQIERSIEGMLEFNEAIVEATSDLVSSYKINFAFYEQYGRRGYELLEKTVAMIPKEIHIIADAKRGDIGNTSAAYAKAVFEELKCDSITVSPYMGKDSVNPFLDYSDKMVFLLCLTSNSGSNDFEKEKIGDKYLYELVLEKSMKWGSAENLGYVVGATHPEELKNIRDLAKERYFLIPGIGAQGGSPDDVMEANGSGQSIINSSRGIIYAGGNEEKYGDYIRLAALELRNQLNEARY
ncbi:MAG: orotidine-5'-phosphate decarboxylase [Ignavibacteriae bacterium HGW-Ignavibacteriae-4]|jgi:orotidine-5'-phosphate decarboxylase|nr:MAG: orotidine-5'-phosphate decarboxylase [Ignavibacteriae bacterium HGW-Ignavibacteriae-4]